MSAKGLRISLRVFIGASLVAAAMSTQWSTAAASATLRSTVFDARYAANVEILTRR